MRRLAVVCAALLVAACTQARAPVTGRTQYMLVSEEAIERQSDAMYHAMVRQIAARGQLNTDNSELARVNAIEARLLPAAISIRPEVRAWRWEANVAHYPEVNAFCMAGGKIMVFDGLIKRLHATDDEIAAVLSHEMGHVLAQHQREQISLRLTEGLLLTGAAVGLSASGGRNARDAGLTVDLAAQLSNLLVTLPHSRGQESEADRIGITLMAKAGYNPHAMVSLFRKMERVDGKMPEFLSTHPSIENREAAIETALQSSPEFQVWAANTRPEIPPETTRRTAALSSHPFFYAAGYGAADERRYKEMAAAGDTGAQLTLGLMYVQGRGVPQDRQGGAQWIVRAAAEGNPIAENQVGVLYRLGIGVPRSDGIAVRWFQKAAQDGAAVANSNLGLLYLNGQGVPRDYGRAAKLFEAAAAAEVPEGMYNLGLLYANGTGVIHDDATAAALYRRAADRGYLPANINLSAAYLTGRGVPRDDAKGFELAKAAADRGDLHGMYIVGLLYHEGRGVEKNDTLAELYIRLSAERGFAEAQYAAGTAYATGTVVEKDEAQAVEWFRKAAAQGHQKAKEELARRGLS